MALFIVGGNPCSKYSLIPFKSKHRESTLEKKTKTTITRDLAAESIPPEWDRFVAESECDSLFLQSRYFTLEPILKWRPVCYQAMAADDRTPLWMALVYERRIRFGIRVALPGVNTPVMGFVPARGMENFGLLEAGLDALIKRLRADYRLCRLPLAWNFPHTDMLVGKDGVLLSQSGTTVLEYREDMDEEALLSACRSNRRWSIRRAQKEGVGILIDSSRQYMNEFLRLYQDTYQRQGISPPMSADDLLAYCRQIVERQMGHLTFAMAGDKVAAAVLTAGDDRYDYYLSGVYDEDLKVTNALSLLVFQRIVEAFKKGKGFDFEGSEVPGIRAFFESYGGRYVPSTVCLLRSGLTGFWLSRKFHSGNG